MTPQETLENLKRIILIQTLHKLQINKQKVKKVIRFSSITLPYETSTKWQWVRKRWCKNTHSRNHSSCCTSSERLLWGTHQIKMPIRIHDKTKEPPEPPQHAEQLAIHSKCYYSFHNITRTPQRTNRMCSEHLVISQKIWNEVEYIPSSRSKGIVT